MVHIGIGYDVHPLVEGRKFILGGVDIPHTKGLDGHSDADALMHAIAMLFSARSVSRTLAIFSTRSSLARCFEQSLSGGSHPTH